MAWLRYESGFVHIWQPFEASLFFNHLFQFFDEILLIEMKRENVLPTWDGVLENQDKINFERHFSNRKVVESRLFGDIEKTKKVSSHNNSGRATYPEFQSHRRKNKAILSQIWTHFWFRSNQIASLGSVAF